MTDSSPPRPDPWRRHTDAPAGYPALDPDAPAWARQAHAQGTHRPPADGFVQPMFPPTAQQQPHQQPGYLPPGYPPGAYQPRAYQPSAYPPGAYPPGTYPPGAYPLRPTGPVKPGVVTGAAVLAFVQAGLLVIAGILTLAGGSALSDLDVTAGRAYTGVLTVLGLLTLVSAGLLIAGGVTVHQRKPQLLIAGAALSLVLSLWWAVQFDARQGALIFAVMPIISLSLVLGATTRAWIQEPDVGR